MAPEEKAEVEATLEGGRKKVFGGALLLVDADVVCCGVPKALKPDEPAVPEDPKLEPDPKPEPCCMSSSASVSGFARSKEVVLEGTRASL